MDFTAFDTRSKFAAEINAGYSARLDGKRLSDNPHLVWVGSTDELEPKKLQPLSEKGHAWQHGWRGADKDEKSRGRRGLMWSKAPPPNAAEEARIELSKVGPCMACLSLASQGLLDMDQVFVGGDYQHTKSGNIRRGHWFGFCLCVWHHRRHPFGNRSFALMREIWGPSLMDGSRTFHETYGTDDELIEQQTFVNELREAA